MTDEFIVQNLSAGDVEAVAALFENHSGIPAKRATFERWITDHPSAGATDGGQLVGYLACCQFAPDVLEAASVVVAPSHRNRGIAARLFAHLEASAGARGFSAVIVAPSSLHASAGQRADHERLYESLGYTPLYSTGDTLITIKALTSG